MVNRKKLFTKKKCFVVGYIKVLLSFLVTLFRVELFIRSLPYGSFFSPAWNRGSLIGLS